MWFFGTGSAVFSLNYPFLDDDFVYEKRLQNVIDLYRLQLQAVGHISKKNVLMLCIDGLRRRDILNGLMPELSEYIKNNMVLYRVSVWAC